MDYHKLNQVDKITCPVDISEFISSATLILAQRDHRQSSFGDKAGVMHVFNNMDFQYASAIMDFQYGSAIWLLTLQNAQSANSLLSPWYGISPQEDHSFTWLYILKHF